MLNKRGQSYLTTGDGHDPFLPKLLSAVNEASEIDLAVAFVKATGLALLFDPLRDALIAGARLRILTGDYLCVTDAEALRTLLILKEEGADVRVFRSDGKSFHMKAYIFVENCPGGSGGHAFVGSSNISQSALQHVKLPPFFGQLVKLHLAVKNDRKGVQHYGKVPQATQQRI